MLSVDTITELRDSLAIWRSDGQRLAFVPTMGNLHAGHMALVQEARRLADRTVVSIFVNPLQFGAGEDFDGYPRTLDQDREQLRQAGVDQLFMPAVASIYPADMNRHTRVEVPGLSDILCGANRPEHFIGVATVVCKLFNMVQPDIALFGEKDFQQLLVIRRMVEDLAMPVQIVGLTTQRETDGLALSSRNRYLTEEERRRAPILYQTLQSTAERIQSGVIGYDQLQQQALDRLQTVGFRPDYFSVRSATDLAEATADDRDLVIVAAAYLGRARLIDNLRVRLSSTNDL